jgi:ubiquinol-cytochrome c reductase iron-sulfur subunit
MPMHHSTSPPTRRDFLSVSAGAFVTVGGTFAAWPFIDQMNPNPGTPSPETRLVDLAPIGPGQVVTVTWRGQPVLVRHRTSHKIEQARSVPCHAARFDVAGRVRAGPARTNLPVPPYRFVTASKIEIGTL